jgi:hypothetical protein
MEESKAYAAEQIYRERQLDTVRTTYAIVYIKDGKELGIPMLQTK